MLGYRVVSPFTADIIVGLLGCWPFSHCVAGSIGIRLIAAGAAQQPNLSNRGL